MSHQDEKELFEAYLAFNIGNFEISKPGNKSPNINAAPDISRKDNETDSNKEDRSGKSSE